MGSHKFFFFPTAQRMLPRSFKLHDIHRQTIRQSRRHFDGGTCHIERRLPWMERWQYNIRCALEVLVPVQWENRQLMRSILVRLGINELNYWILSMSEKYNKYCTRYCFYTPWHYHDHPNERYTSTRLVTNNATCVLQILQVFESGSQVFVGRFLVSRWSRWWSIDIAILVIVVVIIIAILFSIIRLGGDRGR